MEEPQQNLEADAEATLVVGGEEATLVAPRFDDEETLVARPVVPLEEAAVEAPSAPTPARAPLPREAYSRTGPRRPWLLALVLVSVLIGGVLGGGGLYLYQRQSQDDGAAATPRAQTPTAAEQPLPAPGAANVPPAAPPASAANAPADEEANASGQGDGATNATPGREAEHVPATERRPAPGAEAGTPKRGKKGERDEEIERSRRRADSGGTVSRAGADDAAGREARRVDSISYRARRATRRDRAPRETAGDADRLRRIFEGTPE